MDRPRIFFGRQLKAYGLGTPYIACKHNTVCRNPGCSIESASMLLILAILLVLFWVGGFAFHVAGGLIHILLVVAVILFILHFVRGRGV